MKMAVFIGAFGLGGPQARLLRYFFPYWESRNETEVSLLLLQRRGELLASIPRNVAVYDVGETMGMKLPTTVARTGRILRELKPDVVISFMWYPAVVSFLARKAGYAPFRHIVHETLNMSGFVGEYFKNRRFTWLQRFLIRSAYRDAEKVVAVSEGVKRDLRENFGIPREKVAVIHNPLDREYVARMASAPPAEELERPYIVASGRLTYQKGFDILLKAFSRVRSRMKAKLVILGEGDGARELSDLAHTLGLDGDVILAGFQQNPFALMAGAAVFCSSSRYEGFSNVILEAMALGLPVVATDCPSGSEEILDGGKYGLLVPSEDPEALAESLARVLSDSHYRATLSGLSLRRAEDFDPAGIMEEWEGVWLGSPGVEGA
jgi:glycosyltransferase involved in cell wall biosynthesis